MYRQKPVTEMEANLHPLWNIICRNNIHDLVMGVIEFCSGTGGLTAQFRKVRMTAFIWS
jgi:hypothetical protein